MRLLVDVVNGWRSLAFLCAALALSCSLGCGKLPVSPEHPKLAAFRKVVAKFEQTPDRYAGDTERRQYNGELADLISKFDAIPFDVEMNTDVAKAICELFEERLEGKYQGMIYNEIDDKVRVMYSNLLSR